MIDQYIQEIQQYLQLLQYGAVSAIIAAFLAGIAIIILLIMLAWFGKIERSLDTLEKGTRYNSLILQEISKRVNVPLPPVYP